MYIKIYNKNFDLSPPFKNYLLDKFKTIDKYQADILSFRVDLSRDQHHKKGEVFTIDVKLNLPNKKNIILQEIHADPRAAVDILQDKLARQLVKTKDKKISQLRRRAAKLKSLKFWKKKEY
jgi:ribosomal subunit interface protein